MQPTQQPVQAKPMAVQKPGATVTAQQKPIAEKTALPVKPGQPVQPGQPVKKPSKWWIWVLVAALVIGGGIFAYFQFLA